MQQIPLALLLCVVGVSSNSVPSAPPPSAPPSDGLTTGAIAGIVIGVVAVLAVLAGMVYFYVFDKRMTKQNEVVSSSTSTTAPSSRLPMVALRVNDDDL